MIQVGRNLIRSRIVCLHPNRYFLLDFVARTFDRNHGRKSALDPRLELFDVLKGE